MIVRKPSSHFINSSTSSLNCLRSPSAEDCDADDDEETMSNGEYEAPRPLTVAIPTVGPYCPRRPNLREILANTSSAPWTLAAFMAYLSNNHCLETLEFTMDAGRYKKHYAKMMSRASEGTPPSKDRQYVQELWTRLVEAYIRPNGSREVNLPSNVRDSILDTPNTGLPPPPERLDPAVAKVYELMEDSVLVPFLNSAYPQSAHPTMSSCPSTTSDDGMSVSTSRSQSSQAGHSRRAKSVRASEPFSTAIEPYSSSYSAPANMSFRKSAPSPLTHRSRFSAKLTTSTSSPAAPLSRTSIAEGVATESESSLHATSAIERIPAMMDDSGSTTSPTGESPSTPPMSPPMSDGSSPKRDSGMWKKLGRLSGMKAGRKKSLGKLKAAEE